MPDVCNKTYSELYVEKWQEDVKNLTSLTTGLTDKISFAIQVALATSEITSSPGVIASIISSLAGEIGVTTSGISAAFGGAADVALSGASAASIASNIGGEAIRRLIGPAKTAILRVLGAAAPEALAPVLAAIETIAIPVLEFVAIAVAAFAAKVAVEAADAYNAQSSTPHVFDLRTFGVNEGITVENLTSFIPLEQQRESGLTITVEGRAQHDFEGMSSGIMYPAYSTECADEIILTDYADVFNVGHVDLSRYDDWHLIDSKLTINLSDAANGNVSSADFDTVQYVSRIVNIPGGDYFNGPAGVYWNDGATHDASIVKSGIFYVAAGIATAGVTLLGPVGIAVLGNPIIAGLKAGFKAESLTPDEIIHVKNVENITLSELNDRLYFSGSDYSSHSGYGTIDAGAGNDLLLYQGAKFIAAGTVLDPVKKAASDARKAENIEVYLDISEVTEACRAAANDNDAWPQRLLRNFAKREI